MRSGQESGDRASQVGWGGLSLCLAAAALATALLVAPAAAGQGGADIVGGQATTIEEWPWQVAIADPPSKGGDGQQRQFCGGSLVSATAVLTAAHCADGDRGFQQPGAFSVITGRTTLSDSSSGAEIPVTDVIYFVSGPGGAPTAQSVTQPAAGPRLYDRRAAFDWDVVILRLASPAPAPAAPVAIATTAEFNALDLSTSGDQVFATGYGTQFFGAPFGSNTLQEVELDTISDADCGDATSYGSGFLSDVMVCAGNLGPPPGGRDSCQGDSGGPLVAPAAGGTFKLIGDTSFGEGCAVPEKWGVYGRLAGATMRPAIIDAITLASNGQAPPGSTPPTNPGAPGPSLLDPLVDRVAPETKFTKRPGKRTRKRRATYEWTATEAATFTCKLDKRPATDCTSPMKVRVKRGRHTFAVTATDSAGNVEASPAKHTWKVRKRKRR